MSTNKQDRAKQNLLKQIEQLSKINLKQQIQWLLVVGKSNFSQSGFVLPTTVMMLLVATLVVGALLFRSFNRTTQVISEREQKVIYNTATPAIDRAKAKMEYLFKKDNRLPNGIPSDAVLISMMLNDGLNGVPKILNSSGTPVDKYTFPGETRLNIGDTTALDNAWAFKVDKDGDGTPETTIAYSILSNTRKTGTTPVGINDSESIKASNLIVRNGPIAGSQVTNANCLADSRLPEQGWYPVTNTTLRKSFQINAFVVSDNPTNRTVTTLEVQQDRQLNRGSKWGAWFRNDLEVFPGPAFNFNGAMHTEGSLIVGGSSFTSYMLSSHNSCFYTQEASEISVAKSDAYEGQIVAGRININSLGTTENPASSFFHLFNGLGTAPIRTTTAGGVTNLTSNTDSITQSTGNLIEDISLDPIAVFTSNLSKHRNSSTWTRDSNWAARDFVTKRRIFNDTSPVPYVDDTYRADNRYGPKPGYNSALVIPTTKKIGDTIVASGTVTADDVTALTNDAPAGAASEAYGFDGYWERRARGSGLRIIVGQRLELGNAYGWGGADDPLNPTNAAISNEQRQRRALRDNLAAVQATAVYHHEKNSGYFPTAFVATTVHPGTAKTLSESKNFTDSLIGTLNIDFLGTTPIDLTGDGFADINMPQGTNGWEFEVVPGLGDETEATFAGLINDSTSPLRKALANLARFAGDPDGAFPPKQEANGSKIVHPFPELTMWGNFSNLRRVVSDLEGGKTYATLSIADKSTLHTAAGTLGMLAYNLKNYTDIYTAIANDTNGLKALGVQFFQLMDGNATNGNGEIGKGVNGLCDYNNSTIDPNDTCPAFVNSNSPAYDPTYYQQFTGDDYFKAFKNNPGLGTSANNAELLQKAALLIAVFQVERDRTFGFTSRTLSGQPGIDLPPVNVPGEGTYTFKVGCSQQEIDDLQDALGNNAPDKPLTGLALSLCSLKDQPKYPALYYLFPKVNHDHDGNNDLPTGNNHTQPNTEPYIGDLQDIDGDANTTESNTYITGTNVNGNYNYQVVSSTDPDDFSGILLNPKNKTLTGGCTDINWCLPTTATSTDTKENRITKPGGTSVVVPFLDTAFSNGREMMNIRALNIDLDILRRNLVTIDTWLPSIDGIIYAFREDAVREDSIARPRSVAGDAATAWTAYLGASATASYRMDVPIPKDPPVNSTNGISPKPVDYYADPDRRPYGFRLTDGASIKRENTSITAANNINGLSFISDNAVYIQGDFNLHSTNGTTANLIEEFSGTPDQRLGSDWTANPEFYGGRTSINPNFADPTQDTWRPTEILADAVTILSSAFNDGKVEDAFLIPRPSASAATNTSYQNQNRPTNTGQTTVSASGYWLRENISNTNALPIKIDKYGSPLRCLVAIVPCPSISQIPYTTPFRSFTEASSNRRQDLNIPVTTRVNAIFVSGLIPSRAGQSYGGLHNFPRFLEDWQSGNGFPLYISGAFLQLNFSTSANAPFDQDAWEPTATPDLTQERIGYYDAPFRRWGYDVGLQYAPSGPAARRFITTSNTRSEFYRELAVEDPYIKNLRCARYPGTDPIDTSATCP